MYTFTLTDEQTIRLCQWTAEQNRVAVELQKANPPEGAPRELLESCWEEGFPYGGAIGGSLTFMFTPTGLGVVTRVRDAFTHQELDLSDYEDW